ncbi:PspC domain-containing protein [Terrimonas sp. NA20]|uniref:PspC domain-containing protein n=1 Tax=Terrimonas ginsenosidimutans TaxID=2908004 RepID=A0ABS9KKY6_9BACT|nr:PspC domain-containing protein [Terrimonas ginsenosidimutans]MCG2612977.1 PspC domain-containing protein [Terrimonas ginsenosidimutans]
MKKIININLSGRVIPIEDSAYEKLQGYIESLRRHFANEEGRDEIINDIESRIAELMNDKIRKGASCVTDADVDEIIASMGRPEDFDDDAADAESNTQAGQSQQQYYDSSNTRPRTRLFRDTSDKLIGGVCSGLAAYMNVDPSIVRILFAIITFGGFGVGFLIYIILWMVLPTKDLEGYTGKRLYRNSDDKVIGGVAGGLAAYFNKESWLIRLIFVGPLALNILFGIIGGLTWSYHFDVFPNIVFGSLNGTLFLIYIVLWMVLPEAKTNYEKMEMRGEKVDVNRIRDNVRQEMGGVRDRVKNWSEEVKESAQNFGNRAKEFANTKGKAFTSEVNDTARRSGQGIGHMIGVIFKAFFLFVFGSIVLALFVVLLALLFGGMAWWPVTNFLWTSNTQKILALGTLLFFLVVPLVGLITWVIRRLIGVRSRNSYLGWTFGFLWTIGWVCLILLVSSITRDFKDYQQVSNEIALSKQPSNGKMIVMVKEQGLDYRGNFGWLNDDIEGWDISDDTMRMSTIRINVIPSADSSFHVFEKKHSYGRDRNDALKRAQSMNYSISAADSILDIGNGYNVGKDVKFRLQQVEVEIHVPVGKKIRFDRSVREKLNPSKFTVKRSRRRFSGVNIDNDYGFNYSTNTDYVMTAEGLKSLSRINTASDPEETESSSDGRSRSSDYRYERKAADSIDLERKIEEEKRKKDESERVIRELQEQQKKSQSTSAVEMEKLDNNQDDAIGSPSGVFSIVRWL